MSIICDKFKEFCNEVGLECTFHESDNYAITNISGDNSDYTLLVRWIDATDQQWGIFSSQVISPSKVPSEKRLKICEFITRINCYDYKLAFRLNFEDGEVKCTLTDVIDSNESWNKLIFHPAIILPRDAMNMIYPHLMEQIYSNITPQESIEKLLKK